MRRALVIGWLTGLVLVIGLTGPTLGASSAPVAAAAGEHAAARHQEPVLPQSSTLAGVTIILILGMFLAAAVIGPIVRANLPEEIPVTHSHDEPPGASHHYGASGTH